MELFLYKEKANASLIFSGYRNVSLIVGGDGSGMEREGEKVREKGALIMEEEENEDNRDDDVAVDARKRTPSKGSFLSSVFVAIRRTVEEESEYLKSSERFSIGSQSFDTPYAVVTNIFRIFLSQSNRYLTEEMRRARRIHGRVTSADFDGHVLIHAEDPRGILPKTKTLAQAQGQWALAFGEFSDRISQQTRPPPAFRSLFLSLFCFSSNAWNLFRYSARRMSLFLTFLSCVY